VAAERKEVKVLKDMGVAPVVDLPPGKAVIRGKMIYAYKYSEDRGDRKIQG